MGLGDRVWDVRLGDMRTREIGQRKEVEMRPAFCIESGAGIRIQF